MTDVTVSQTSVAVTASGASTVTTSATGTSAASVDIVTAVPNEAYTSYTAAIEGSSSDPGLDGASYAYYQRLGRRVFGYAFYSLSSAGSGVYGFALPVTPVDRTQPIGTGYLFDLSADIAVYVGAAAVVPTTNTAYGLPTGSATVYCQGMALGLGQGPVGSASPFAMATGDSIVFQFDYEAAA